MPTRVFYQCTGRSCGLETPYRPGRSEHYCAACGARLQPRIERDQEEDRSRFYGPRDTVRQILGGDVGLDGLAIPLRGAPSAASLLAVAEQIDRIRASRR